MRALINKCSSIVASNIREKFLRCIVLLLVFCVDLQAQNITELEYFFGNDPGIGNGTLVTATANTGDLTQSIAISLTGLPSGFHNLTFRAKNDANISGLFSRETFYIIDLVTNDPISNLAAVEYWFGADPGNGNGTPLVISGEPSETVENFAIPLGTLETGFHTLSIRVKNLEDTWSLFSRETFYIIDSVTNDPASPLTDAEFLYDANLGFGTGTAVAITPTGNPDEYIVEIPTDIVACGLHDISLSVMNALGNYSLYDITVDTDVFDNLPPTIVVFPNITVALDANGEATPFTIANVNDGTFDDCELVSVILNQVQFDYTCANLGANTVTVTATDAEAKVSTLDVIVMVEDSVNPVAITQNITVQLDASGNAITTADAIDNNSTDNCSIASRSLDVSSFTCANLGMNTVALTVTDQSGNQNTTNATVMVEDTINPVAIGQDINISLEGNPSVSIVASDVDNGSNDNCSGVNLSIDIDTFIVIGVYPVILTITDSSGNTSNVTVIVTVTDATLSIEEFNSDEFKVFPNPTTNILHINFEQDGDYSFSVYDISGKEILREQKLEINNTLNLFKYASGVYFFKIKNKISNTIQNFKIVKM